MPIQFKKKYIFILFLACTFILFLIGIFIYFLTDDAIDDDSHLQVVRKEVNSEENGYEKIKESVNLFIKIKDVTKVQSAYIFTIDKDKRQELLTKIISHDNLNKIIDLKLQREFLKVNKQSLIALETSLEYKKFFFDTEIPLGDYDDQKNIFDVIKLFKLKFRDNYDQANTSNCLKQISYTFKLAKVYEENSRYFLDNIISWTIKRDNVKALLACLEGEKIDAESIFNIFGDLEKFKSKPDSYDSFLKFIYNYTKNELLKMDFTTDPEIGYKGYFIGFIFKKNMTLNQLNKIFTMWIGKKENAFVDRSFFQSIKNYKRKSIHRNSFGDVAVFPLIVSGQLRANYFIINSKITLLNTLIALMRYEARYNKLPDRIDQLIPEYLSKMPLDAFNNKPIKYSKKDRKIWSVGCEILDDFDDQVMEDNDAVLIIPVMSK
ncbi:MAG: hypothetical protein COA79_22005 [Planctomycetota bacterium]|nr:MAG: hypothetical protein COA79_22005 [Planctomycetota bacterium]